MSRLACGCGRIAGRADHWLAAAEPGLTLKALLERSEVVVVGLDGGGLDDLFGLCVIGRCRATRRWLAWTRAWGQLSVLNRREIAPTLEGFVADGDLVICGEVARDVLEIADLIESIADTGLLPEKRAIGIDPMAIAAVTDELEARNLGGADRGNPAGISALRRNLGRRAQARGRHVAARWPTDDGLVRG